MEKVKVVIEIPKIFYEYCKAEEGAIEVHLAIKNGTLLPKGHGRIGDLDELQKVLDEYVLDRKDCPMHIASEIYYNIDTFEPIIAADEEGED